MTYSWQQQRQPRTVGMKREQLLYGNLLQTRRPSTQSVNGSEGRGQAVRESSIDIYAPPESLSSKMQRSNGLEANARPSSQISKAENGNDNQDLFFEYYSSQSKSKRSYSKTTPVNYHKREPPNGKKKNKGNKRQQPASFIEEGLDGFKKLNGQAVDLAVPTANKRGRSENFKVPAGSSLSPRSKRAQMRAAKEEKDTNPPARTAIFKKPPPPPTSPPSKKSSPPPFIVPQGLPHVSNGRRLSESDTVPQTEVTAQSLQTIKDIRGLADTVQARLNAPFDASASLAIVSYGAIFDVNADDSSSLSSLSSVDDGQELTSPTVQCPICKDFVPRLFREEFSRTKHLSIREQADFCKAHKLRSAGDTWRARGYPTIDWHRFPERLPIYEPAVREILNGTRRSFYRNMFEDQVKRGANRTLQQSMLSGGGWEGLNVGYYGTKGARILMDYIMSEFASSIRRLAGTDRLVSAGGVSGFVQAVLAPELAVMLVKDDMHINEEQARVILKESSEIGHLLNEEEDEVIRDMEEREATQL
ncbi:MAG: hypothetical protein Q9220_001254 [cf. Caloplaca sp. 1 TL-2023]